MISIRFFLRSFHRAFLLILFGLPAASGVGAAQQTGEWIAVDSKHEGRFNTSPLLVAAADRGHYIVMTREDIAIGPYTIRRTTDAGATWQIVRADSGQSWRIVDIAYPSEEIMFAVGDAVEPSGGSATALHAFVLRSIDAGATWERQVFSDTLGMQSFAMADATSGALITGRYFSATGEVYRFRITTDGGATWVERNLPEGDLSIGRVFSRAPGSYVVTAYDDTEAKWFVHMTSDAGLTWETHPLPSGIYAMDFADGDLGVGVGGLSTGVGHTQSDLIARTTDGGRSWTKVVDAPVDFRFGLDDVDLADATHGIAVGGYCKIYRTSDGGLTWQQEWPPSFIVSEYANLVSVAYPVADEALATTAISSYVLKYTGRQRLVAPRITAPSTGLSELPLEVEVAWGQVEGALWYDLQVGDTTYEYNIVNHRIFDEPYIDEVGLTATTRTVFLEPRSRYEIRVRARNQNDTSDWSVRLSALSRASGQTLTTPGFILPLEGATDVAVPTRLEWTAVSGATGYDLMVSDNPLFTGSDVTNLNGHPATSYDATLKPNTTYFAIVRARNATEIGNWSNIAEGTRSFTTGSTSRVPERHGASTGQLSISPNPVADGQVDIVIKREVAGITTLQLIDARGVAFTPFFSRRLPSGRTSVAVDLSGYPAGTYFIRMDDEQGSVVEKVVKVE